MSSSLLSLSSLSPLLSIPSLSPADGTGRAAGDGRGRALADGGLGQVAARQPFSRSASFFTGRAAMAASISPIVLRIAGGGGG
uniref:Uncharacterized protein n=1 Tax=Oryza sativa subsp. japonica TaxID=39947 RepID=Q69RN0_ORYSJ|nr:hypothetical protein [Oryza sativa Japonica Group]